MTNIVQINKLNKSYGKEAILKDINLTVPRGEIIGLIGPNGAGKTTLLKTILGLAPYSGDIDVLGMDPHAQRAKLMKRISFVADTAILPGWLKVKDAIQFMSAVHPAFNAETAEAYIRESRISLDKSVRHLSKGMVTKVHLSLIMAIDSELLILDEPTLGLDIVNKKSFYQQLLSDYFDKNKTIIITTHQVEEVEGLLTRSIFIHDGELILDEKTEDIESRFYMATEENNSRDTLVSNAPIHIFQSIKGEQYIFDRQVSTQNEAIKGASSVALSDLFVAMITRSNNNLNALEKNGETA